MIPKLDWKAFRKAAHSLDAGDFPEVVTEELKEDDEFMQKLHHALLEVVLVDGNLVCPETGRKFPVKNCIPNMMLNETEV